MKLPLAGAAFAIGIGISVWLSDASTRGWAPGWETAALWSLGALALAFVFRRLGAATLLPVLLLIFAIGIWRGDLGQTAPATHAAIPRGEMVSIQVELLADPRPFGGLQLLRVRAADVDPSQAGDQPADLEILADRLSGDLPPGRSRFSFRYGDVYRITGEVEDGLDENSAGLVRRPSISLLSNTAGNVVRRTLANARAELADSMRSSISAPASGLAAAITVGDRTGLEIETRTSFRAAGTAHLLAISGLHVGIIGVAVMAMAATALGRRRQLYLLAPLFSIWGYAALAGFSDPVIRASIMLTAYLAARAFGRQRAALPALGLAATAMLAADPSAIAEISFQLSFASLAGILLLAPRINRGLDHFAPARFEPFGVAGRPLVTLAVRGALQVLGVGLAATIATLPLIGHTFGTIPVWGIPATALALPALPFAVGFSGLSGAAGLASETAGDILGWPAWLATTYVLELVDFFARLPPKPIETSFWSVPTVIGYYIVVTVVAGHREVRNFAGRAWTSWRKSAPTPLRTMRAARPAPKWLITAAVIGALLSLAAVWNLPDNRLSVTFFETDRGDLILIQTPGGRQMLIDGGLDSNEAVNALGRELPFWDRSIDIVALTHPHADHVGGLLKALEQYDVDYIVDAPVDYDSEVYRAWLKAADTASAIRINASPGQRLILDEDVYIDVLNAGAVPWSDDVNGSSVAMRLNYKDVSFLLTGDINSATERELLKQNVRLDSTVLKVAHQGSRGSSSDRFLAAVSPAVSVVPVGTRNPFGHPHEDALRRVTAATQNGRVYTTAGNGDVRFTTDGHRLWVRTER